MKETGSIDLPISALLKRTEAKGPERPVNSRRYAF